MSEQERIPIFIGTSANGEDAESEMVLEHTLRKNSSRPIDITWMRLTRDKNSIWDGWKTKYWATPFSGFRWAIPEANGFQGKAIYMDEDMLNMHDIAELFDLSFEPEKYIMARRGKRFSGREFCVLLMDCEGLKNKLPPVRKQKRDAKAHLKLIEQMTHCGWVQDLDPRWNCLDGDGLPIDEIWHLHYTKMASQPWQPAWFRGIPEKHERQELVDLWFKSRDEALAAGYKAEFKGPAYGEYKFKGK
jgi:hypothetical protein